MTTNPNTTSDTSFSSVRYIYEDEWGVTPKGTSGDKKQWQELRFTGEAINLDRQTTISNEVREDRQVPDLIATNIDTGGTVDGEFSANTYDEFLKAVMYNDWKETKLPKTGSTKLRITASPPVTTGASVHGNIFTVVVDSGDVGFIKGQLIKVSGFATTLSANNGIYLIKDIKVVEATSGTPPVTTFTYTLTVTKDNTQDPSASDNLVSGSTSATAGKIEGKYLIVGNNKTPNSYSIEKYFTDVGTSLLFTGMAVDKFMLTVQAENIITNQLTFMGKYNDAFKWVNVDTDPIDVNRTIKSTGYDPIFNAGNNAGLVEQDGEKTSLIASMTLEIMNNLRGKAAIGSIGNFAIGTGQFNVSGSISLYFANLGAYEDFKNNDDVSVNFNLIGMDGEDNITAYGFYIPKIKYSNATVDIGGNNADVMMESNYQGLLTPVETGISDSAINDEVTTIIISKVSTTA